MLFKQFDTKAERAKGCRDVTPIPSTTNDAKSVGVTVAVSFYLSVSIDTIAIVENLFEIRHDG